MNINECMSLSVNALNCQYIYRQRYSTYVISGVHNLTIPLFTGLDRKVSILAIRSALLPCLSRLSKSNKVFKIGIVNLWREREIKVLKFNYPNPSAIHVLMCFIKTNYKNFTTKLSKLTLTSPAGRLSSQTNHCPQ